jgi:maltose alpha-D-glucosyltransferase/alpha-amylase
MTSGDVDRRVGLPQAIASWLPQARWCVGGTAAELILADACHADGVTLALVDARSPAGGEPVRYVVPVTNDTGADAACTPAFARWLVDVVTTGRSVPGLHGTFVGRPAGGQATSADAPDDVVPLGADASNTSCLVRARGGGCVTKLLRRCRAGIQPEVEIGAFFATQSPFAATPRLRGWLEYRPGGGGPTTALATIHDHLPSCESAWDVLGRLLTDGGLDGQHRDRIAGLVAAIGRVTAAMHVALAARPDVPAFAPHDVTTADRAAAAADLMAHATEVLAVAAAATALPAGVADRVRRVVAAREAIGTRLRGIADVLPPKLIRVHGDFHLGQVLVAAADDRVFVIDFEGEPGRSLETRRAFAPAAKDVAGMCRSFDYLARHAGVSHPSDTAATLARHYRSAYATVAAGHPWWPAEDATADRLVKILALDKAVYELAYELRHRPDWVGIPLAGIEAALACSGGL